ncbi:MAG: Bug family tripartite tricarboxylate transporter substrate binding protein [Hyphomicrobiales bacterium]
MKHFVRNSAVALVFAAGTMAPAAMAQDRPWSPEEPLQIVVPWAAGGATDQVTRITAGELERILDVSVVVVNQPGASGSIGKRGVLEGDKDGLTWAAGAPKQLGTYQLLDLLDTSLDDWHIYNTVVNVPVISVNPDTPFETFPELLEALQERGNEISVGTAGATSSGHVAIEAIRSVEDFEYQHVPYDGGNPAVLSTVSGETMVTTQLASEQAEMIRGDRLRPLAVVGDQALEIDGYGTIPPITEWLDDIPVVSTHFGIFVPKGVPDEVVETFNDIWENEIAESEALMSYAREAGALFDPSYGEAAIEDVWPEVQADAWMLHDAGRTEMSPEDLDIPRP